MREIFLPTAFALSISIANAQDHAAAPVAAVEAATAPATTAGPNSAVVRQLSLPANSDIAITVVAPLKSGKEKVGHTFKIVTIADILQDGAIVIPKGTEGLGQVIFSKGGGSFGKSGQMELAFTSLSLNGQTIALQGKYREQAGGNGGAATGAVLAAGLVGGFLVHGHSVQIPVGKVMHAQNAAAVTIDIAAAAPAAAASSL